MRTRTILLPILLAASACIPGGLGCGQAGSSQETPTTAEVALPAPVTVGQVSLEETLAKRRSIRQFRAEDLSIEQVGQLAWAAQGITEPNRGLRTAPSAGATYPLELYLVKRDGVYQYVPQGHKLRKLSEADVRRGLSEAALGQSWVHRAPLSIVIAAVYARTEGRYGDRAERYVILEAGHAAQNIHLEAVALGLGSVPVGAFRDQDVARVLDLPQDQQPLYIIPVGHPAG